MKNKRVVRVYAYKAAPENPTMSQRFTGLSIAVDVVNLIAKMTGGELAISNFTGGVVEEYDTVICEITEETEAILKHAFPFVSIYDRSVY